MKPLSFFRAAVAVSFAGLLAACGGGGGSSPELPPGFTFVQPAWASPAMLVPPGQTSKTFSLNGGCSWSNLNGINGSEGRLHTVTLVVSSSGSLTLNGATATTATIGPVLSYSIGGQDEVSRSLIASASNGIATTLNLRAEGNSKLAARFSIEQSSRGAFFTWNGVGTTIDRTTVSPSVSCNQDRSTQTFALSVPPSDSCTQAVFVAPGQTSRLSWLAPSGEGVPVSSDFLIYSGGPALYLDQATGIMSLADTTSTTATLRPLSISGAAYFNAAGSSSTYQELWDSIPADGPTPATQGRTVRLSAYVPTASPVIDLDVYLCSTTDAVRTGRCPSFYDER